MVDEHLLASGFDVGERSAGYSDFSSKLLLCSWKTFPQVPDPFSQILVDALRVHGGLLLANRRHVKFANIYVWNTNVNVYCIVDNLEAVWHEGNVRGPRRRAF